MNLGWTSLALLSLVGAVLTFYRSLASDGMGWLYVSLYLVGMTYLLTLLAAL